MQAYLAFVPGSPFELRKIHPSIIRDFLHQSPLKFLSDLPFLTKNKARSLKR